MTIPALYIAVPAWGPYYVDLACRFTVPAILKSLAESGFRDVHFLIHTDDQASFRRAIGDVPTKFLPLQRMATRPTNPEKLPADYWFAFKRAHKDALAATPKGAICVLLNSDVVVSRECFGYVEREIVGNGKRVVASVGIRTQIEDNDGPPIGAAADELFSWIWGHRHHISDECIWGSGRSHHPTILFFERDGAVAMHCFHLTPMFVLKDREPRFSGTIDDDLLGNYADHEISYPAAGEVAFAELSPTWKTHPFGKPLNVPDVLGFWSRRTVRPHYLRNFCQRMTVLGAPASNHPAADEIIAGLGGGQALRASPPVVPQHIPLGNQDAAEFARFLDFVRDRRVRRYLEIGCRNGDSFGAVMRAIGAGGRGLAVDLPENADAQGKLLDTVAALRSSGISAEVIFGNSRAADVIADVRDAGLFDLVLIDADHRYEGIKADFAVYGGMAPLVALHDVAAPKGHMSDGWPNGVGEFWREIRDRVRHVEFVTPGSHMGFGIVMREPVFAC